MVPVIDCKQLLKNAIIQEAYCEDDRWLRDSIDWKLTYITVERIHPA